MNELSDNQYQSWVSRLLGILFWAFAIYIIVFELIILDECWLETRFIENHTSPRVEDTLRAIYAPLLSGRWMTTHTTTVAP